MDFLFRIMFRRAVTLVVGFCFIGLVSMCSGPRETSAAAGSNPWSKDYKAGESRRSSSTYRSTPRTIRESSGERIDGDEIRRDEAFRRQMLREMREDYESRNGQVDSYNGE